ncbi:hypothetical protein Tco_0143092, partial [Tanacetum coccineum]
RLSRGEDRGDDGDDVTMMMMMTVVVRWGDSGVVVMERMSGGAWSRGSDRSIDEEYIWSSPERVAGKVFRRW